MMKSGVRVQGINATANAPADVVVGQPDMNSGLMNQTLYGKTFAGVRGLYCDGTRFLLRILQIIE
jgi:hypothetical protein